jgi:hypothetical protein
MAVYAFAMIVRDYPSPRAADFALCDALAARGEGQG